MVVVLFGTEMRDDANLDAYSQGSQRMSELVQKIPGFISMKHYSSEDGDEVSVARFDSEESLDAWRFHPEHVEIQGRARQAFYERYWVQVCKTIRDYEFNRQSGRIVHESRT